MLHNILPVLVDELNQYIHINYKSLDDMVVLSNLVSPNGQIEAENENKVVCSLVNIEEERVYKMTSGNIKQGGIVGSSPAPLKLNVYLLFAANFTGKNYVEALKFLTATLGFFQSKSVFNRQNTPALSSNVEKLTFELVNMTYQELTNFWSVIGSKYMPSVLYKVRMITIHEEIILDEIPAISKVDSRMEGR